MIRPFKLKKDHISCTVLRYQNIQYPYYPFGMLIEERVFSSWSYRFGFNGKEKDDEGMGGGGSTYDYGFRIYNPQIAKFLSVDPLTSSYPWYTPYQFAGNLPIAAIDIDGLEEYIFHMETYKNSKGETKLYASHWIYIDPNRRVVGSNGTFIATDMNTISLLKNKPESPRPRQSQYVKSRYDANTPTMERTAYDMTNNNAIAKGLIPGNNYNGKREGSAYVPMKATIKFATSQQSARESFDKMSENQKAALDDLVGALLNDGNSFVVVTGFASPKPVDFNGDGTITEEENLQLALSRATETANFILEYAKEKYGDDAIIDPTRIKTFNAVRDSTPEDGNDDNSEDRVSEIQLKR